MPPPNPQSSILISIIIPTYNYAAVLPRAVASVVQQLAPHHELIVIDDGSTDNTPSIISEFEAQAWQNTRFIQKPNGGASSARNRGIVEALGDWLVFLDADDALVPTALASLDAHIAEHPKTRLIIGGHTSVFPSGKLKDHTPGPLPATAVSRLRAYLLDKKLVLCNGACAIHKDVFKRGNYPETFRSAEDIPVFAQSLVNDNCTTLPTPLAQIYKHDDSLRHNLSYAKAGGLRLVDEIFSPDRLPEQCQTLKDDYYIQRCLSLFRSAYLAGDKESAKYFYNSAINKNWRTLFKISYLRKAVRVYLKC